MKCAIFLYCVTPHWVPLCDEILRKLGQDECKVIYLNEISCGRVRIGWNVESARRFYKYSQISDQARLWLETADNLLCEVRDADLFIRRSKKGLKTFYTSERWFKPFLGMARLLHPRFLRVALKIGRLLNRDSNFTYLPVGVHAAEDIFRLMKVLSGDITYLFRRKSLAFEAKPGGIIVGTPKMRMWAYYVSSANNQSGVVHQTGGLENCGARKILWIGRLLKLKRVDDLIRAVKCLNGNAPPKFTLDVFGEGPEYCRLSALATGLPYVSFHKPIPNEEARRLMSAYDIYVLSSNSKEGWGAVVSEALEEGMVVFGTKEAGASATQLPIDRLYPSGDIDALCRLLLSGRSCTPTGIGAWRPAVAAGWLINEMR